MESLKLLKNTITNSKDISHAIIIALINSYDKHKENNKEKEAELIIEELLIETELQSSEIFFIIRYIINLHNEELLLNIKDVIENELSLISKTTKHTELDIIKNMIESDTSFKFSNIFLDWINDLYGVYCPNCGEDLLDPDGSGIDVPGRISYAFDKELREMIQIKDSFDESDALGSYRCGNCAKEIDNTLFDRYM